MQTISFSATFDGKHIQMDEAMALKPNTRLLVTILPDDPSLEERQDWTALTRQSLDRAYGTDEPSYSLAMLKEESPKYEDR
jgi:hypothetical protein